MKNLFAAAVLASFIGLAAPAQAFHCPADMRAVDAALAKHPKMSTPDMAKVKALRAKGEALHKAGQHGKSVDALGKALKILGM